MKENKVIHRDGKTASTIFDNRSLEKDYRHLRPLLREGMHVLDVGCGTGAISKDIAQIVGPSGEVIGIDNTAKFIESGRQTYGEVPNLSLQAVDLFNFQATAPFDLIVAARVLQWLNNPLAALKHMKSLLRPGGQISILDYNHEALEWTPEPPASMRQFYATFLRWRADAGMNNRIGEDLADLFEEAGFREIEVVNSDERYERGQGNFEAKVGIWAKVARSKQMVEEGYLEEALRVKAVEEYEAWVEREAISMTMKLNEVRGKV